MKRLVVLVAASLLIASCSANKPPNLSPAASRDYNRTQAIKVIDLLRDTAISANDQVPPLISTSTTRKVVNYHTAALKMIDTAPDWVGSSSLLLYQLTADPSLLPDEMKRLLPYVNLVRATLDALSTQK